MKKENRQLDLSAKFLQMGQALMEEGRETDNRVVSLVGTNLIFLGGIILSENDMRKFSELVSMFSAKKLLDSMGPSSGLETRKLGDINDNPSYDEIIARLKKLRDDSENRDNSENKEDNNEK